MQNEKDGNEVFFAFSLFFAVLRKKNARVLHWKVIKIKKKWELRRLYSPPGTA